MRRTVMAVAAATVLVAALAVTTACTRVRLSDSPSTRTFTEKGSVPLRGATDLTAEIDQGVGDLTLRASSPATDAAQTVFTFSPESWRPEVSSSVAGTLATLNIAQPDASRTPLFGGVRNTWVITLPTKVATDLTMKLGVGRSDVDLRGIELTRLDVSTGVGDTTIDLSGPRGADVAAHVETGVGKLTLRVPRGVGVEVSGGNEGVGRLAADGFIHRGSTLVNRADSGSGPKMRIDLVRGVGDVTIVMVD